MSMLINNTSLTRHKYDAELSNISSPSDGLLLEAYRIFLAISFNSYSQSIYERTLLNASAKHVQGIHLDPVCVIEQSAKNYLMFAGFRTYQIAKSTSIKSVPIEVFASDTSAEALCLLSMYHSLKVALMYDSSTDENNKAIRSMAVHIRKQASDEFIALIQSDKALKEALRIPKHLHRPPKPAVHSNIEKMVQKAQMQGRADHD